MGAEHVLETFLRKEQARFRPHRFFVDNLNTLQIIVKQANEFQAPEHLFFFVLVLDEDSL